MKIAKNKKASLIALFLVLTIAVTLVALPVADAHTPAWTVPTWCYVAVTNSVIGVNQQTVIIFWVNEIPSPSNGAYGDRWTFTVDVTLPDGSNETLGPFTSDAVGSGYTRYTPDQLGNYTIVAKMAEHKMTGLPMNPEYTPTQQPNAAYVNDTYLASTSDPVYLTVQQEPIQPWPDAPLPTQFWTRPINAMNRDWSQLAGDWLSGAAQQDGPTTRFGYGIAPESAHIMWTTPYFSGGVADTRLGDIGYFAGSVDYEPLYLTPPIILNGKLYYNVKSPPMFGWYCVDLYTGETIYFQNTSGPITGVSQSSSGSIPYGSLAFGQVLNFECPNQHGTFAYLWSTSGPGSTWMMFDAFTGNYICSIANVSGGTAVYGKDGSILRYSISGTGANTRLLCWNTTQAIWWRGTYAQFLNHDYSAFQSNYYWYWRPGMNVTYDGRMGYSLNMSIPAVQGSILAVREDQYVIGGTAGQNDERGIIQGNLWALSLKRGEEGLLLWNITFTPPHDASPSTTNANSGRVRMGDVDPEDGVFLFSEGITRTRWVYSLKTGQVIWKSEPEIQMEYYSLSWPGQTVTSEYQGMLLGYGSVAGSELRAYNITTGEIMWKYEPSQIGFESPYGNYPLRVAFIADGKIYCYSTEHTPTSPLWRGSYLRCINASNGAELWKCECWSNTAQAIADGYIVTQNCYDNQLYCFGKGPSATTASVQNDVITQGNSVLIKGTVTDQCAGAKKVAQKLGFTNGVPAVSDESMAAWMEYLYEQQAIPTNATGVDVSLDTIDPNGNYVHIGTVTSDTSGLFSYVFTPEVPGKYTIIATFAGSKSYYASYAETAIGVSEAPPATAPPEYPQPIDYTWFFVGTALAIIIAIALAAVWIKRK